MQAEDLDALPDVESCAEDSLPLEPEETLPLEPEDTQPLEPEDPEEEGAAGEEEPEDFEEDAPAAPTPDDAAAGDAAPDAAAAAPAVDDADCGACDAAEPAADATPDVPAAEPAATEDDDPWGAFDELAPAAVGVDAPASAGASDLFFLRGRSSVARSWSLCRIASLSDEHLHKASLRHLLALKVALALSICLEGCQKP